MRDSLAEKSKKLTERIEGAAKYDGFSFWVKIKCGTHTVFLEIFAGSNFCYFPSDLQMQVTANKNCCKHFSHKKLTPEQIFSNLNSLHKNTGLRNHVCSNTGCLFHSVTKRYTTNYWFYIG